MARRLDGVVQRSDDILSEIKFAVFMRPFLEVFAQGLSSDSHAITINEFVLEQECQNCCYTYE